MSHEPVNWLYPTNESGGYHLLDPHTGDRMPVSPENLLAQIEKYPDRVDEWVLTHGFRLMRPHDAVWIYVAGRQGVFALGRVVGVRQENQGY